MEARHGRVRCRKVLRDQLNVMRWEWGTYCPMGMLEADMRAKLNDSAIPACGWTDNMVKREGSAGAVKIISGMTRQRAWGT